MLARLIDRGLTGMTRRRFRIYLVLLALVLAGSAGFTSVAYVRAPRTTAVVRGRAVAERAGCFACHGEGGRGGVANPGAPTGEIPPLTPHAAATAWVQSERELREWVVRGRPARQTSRSAGLVAMPAYGDHLSAQEVDDLVAWLVAIGGHDRPPAGPAARGRALAGALGCTGCHGEDGRAGAANPGSFKGYIPPWEGPDFHLVVESDAELREWILDGVSRRFADNPAAQVFLRRQAIQMPAYRGRITTAELDDLVAYIRALGGGARPPWQARWLDPAPPRPLSRVEQGRRLYRVSGCAACHGAAGEGGLANRNAAGGVVPPLADLAEKLELVERAEAEAVVAAIEAGADLASAPLPDPERVRARWRETAALVRGGAAVERADPRGPEPPIPMPAFAFRGHPGAAGAEARDVDSILAYLVTLYPWEE